MYSGVVERLSDVLFHGFGLLLGEAHLRPFHEDGANELPQDVLTQEETDFSLMPTLGPWPDGHLVSSAVDIDETNSS